MSEKSIERGFACVALIVLLTSCDTAIGSVVPEQLRTAACVVDSIPAGIAVLDDAIADIETQAAKVRDGVPIVAQDVDGPTALVNVATAIRACLESK